MKSRTGVSHLSCQGTVRKREKKHKKTCGYDKSSRHISLPKAPELNHNKRKRTKDFRQSSAPSASDEWDETLCSGMVNLGQKIRIFGSQVNHFTLLKTTGWRAPDVEPLCAFINSVRSI